MGSGGGESADRGVLTTGATELRRSARPGETLDLYRSTAQRDIPSFNHGRSWDSVLVTGGTGVIGSALLPLLAASGAGRIASVSRRPPSLGHRVEGVEYHQADVRDAEAMTGLVRRLSPSLVIHLASQKDAAVAEHAVSASVSTIVTGTESMVAACGANGVESFVMASTGKASRLFTSDVYAASKQVAEYVVGTAGARFPHTSFAAVRFTHVVDDSVLLRRFTAWAADGLPIRLHGPDNCFFVQSALESSQLLLSATGEDARGQISALRNLGWPPVTLADLALDVAEAGGRSSPVVVVGFEPGYEESHYPGTFDPETAGSVSPLLNGVEAAVAVPHPDLPADIDCTPLGRLHNDVEGALGGLRSTLARTQDRSEIRQALASVGLPLARARVDGAHHGVLSRMLQTAGAHDLGSSDHAVAHSTLDAALRSQLTPAA